MRAQQLPVLRALMGEVVLLGDPVAHSKSPIMHAAAFRALGLPHTYRAVRVGEGELAVWVDRLRRGELLGINVTVPHKRAALHLADSVDESARTADACNVLATRGGRVVAFNTDVAALEAELGQGTGTGLVLGSGGAARAAVIALKRVGATKVIVRARNAALADEPLEATGSERGARWIVQATSAGMTGADSGDAVARAVRFDLAPDALALDVVYEPRETPFLIAARAAGLRTKNGLGMLARQGALAFELWFAQQPPLDVMRAAIE